jgi:hypothetical protein
MITPQFDALTPYLRHAYKAEAPNFGLRLDGPILPHVSRLAYTAPHLLRRPAAGPITLWPALFRVWPNWRHGLQGTGDCVSWGTAHLGDVNLAIAHLNGQARKPDALICQESIYGFGKAELFNSYRWNGAGMMGRDAVEAWKVYGSLYRKAYTADGQTADLTAYSGSRAIAWGERPGATRGVPDWLEPFAAEHKAHAWALIDTPAAALACLHSGRAFQYCGYSYWALGRTADGLGANFTRGAHCMTCVGILTDANNTPTHYRIANTGHGNHVDGPPEYACPGFDRPPEVYQECGGWVPARLVDPILRAGDCYTVDYTENWQPLEIPRDLGFRVDS